MKIVYDKIKEKITVRIERYVGELILLLSMLGFVVGLVWLGYDIIMWLKHGAWDATSFGDLLIEIGANDFVQWIYVPSEWIGLRKICRLILDASAFSIIIATSTAVFAVGIVVINTAVTNKE